MKEEWFPLVDEKGETIGKATRKECHNGSKMLHPVVHLHIFNKAGDLYLQKRSINKDIQPGKWDSRGAYWLRRDGRRCPSPGSTGRIRDNRFHPAIHHPLCIRIGYRKRVSQHLPYHLRRSDHPWPFRTGRWTFLVSFRNPRKYGKRNFHTQLRRWI